MTSRFQSITPAARLSDQVASALTAEIQAGRLGVGEKLPTEAELVQQFGVSRSVIREALSRLRTQGLIDSRQGSGVFVLQAMYAPLNFDASSVASKQAVLQIVAVRRALEAEVAALAAARRSIEDVKRIRSAMRTLDKAVLEGRDGVEEDVAYHRAMADAAGNPFLISTIEYLQQFLRGATRVTRANEARDGELMRQVVQEHQAIADAIEAGDPVKARRAAARHMDNAIQRIEQADSSFWKDEGVKLAATLVKPK
jgi:GntR family transcriptional repressor for pyruvate dehydrogenase complex